VTWIAAPKVEKRSLRATLIGSGVDPRVAWFGEDLYCATRAFVIRDEREASPVTVYRSRDMRNWEQVVAPSSDWLVYQYDLLASPEGLWLCGVRDDAGGAQGVFLLHQSIPGQTAWAPRGALSWTGAERISRIKLVLEENGRIPRPIVLGVSGSVDRLSLTE
jgi:hypothetical protein